MKAFFGRRRWGPDLPDFDTNILAEKATIKQLQMEAWLSTKEEFMKDSNILAGNVVNNFLRRELLQNTKGHCMKVSNILAQMQLQRQICLDIEGEYTKESNILAGIVKNNF